MSSALFIEPCGANSIIRVPGDRDAREHALFTAVPSVPGEAVVTATVGALMNRDLPQVVAQAAKRDLSVKRVWLALSGLGRPIKTGSPFPQRIAESLGIEVLAPDGALSLAPGGLLFVDGGVWRCFRPSDTSRPWGTRFPQPEWEALLPQEPVTVAGLTVEPIPAGLLVRPEGASATSPVDPAYAVAVDPARPRLVLGRPGEAGYSPAQAAALLTRLRTPFELVPHTPRVATTDWLAELAARLGQEVRAATGMPLYALDGSVQFVAHNIEGGHLLRHASTIRVHQPDGRIRVRAYTAPPAGWVVAKDRVFRLPRAAELTPGDPVVEVVPAGLAIIPSAIATGRHAASLLAAEPHRFIVTVGLPGAGLPGWTPEILSSLLAGLPPDALARLRILVLARVTEADREMLADAAGSHARALEFSQVPTGSQAGTAAPVAVEPVTMPHARHRSTKIEQTEFQRLASFEPDPAVPAAERADLAAVRCYLGGGPLGAVAINAKLAAGTPVPTAYLACLNSGLRRLPVHRGVVYRPIRLSGKENLAFGEGEVLTEPGFLTTSATTGIAVPGSDVDLLIWSRNGRRTDDLGVAGLPEEIVFSARTRFKVLALDFESPPAVLLRELHPDEIPYSRVLDTTDVAVLSKLRRALDRRRASARVAVTDEDQQARLAEPPQTMSPTS
ncbi:hypothetical protein [Amycolatopsis sp. NPDC059657]|uniref:hypothetical protein n=1 Tax=Amycolatopsis sp. NPDC059657 TaxID=3346899 RepID=UPI00366D47A9